VVYLLYKWIGDISLSLEHILLFFGWLWERICCSHLSFLIGLCVIVFQKSSPLCLLIMVLEISFGLYDGISLTLNGVSLLTLNGQMGFYFAGVLSSQYAIRLQAVNNRLAYKLRTLYGRSVLACVFEKLNYLSSVWLVSCLDFVFCLALTLSIGLTVTPLIDVLMIKLNVTILKVNQK
jgi:hypothetical protein